MYIAKEISEFNWMFEINFVRKCYTQVYFSHFFQIQFQKIICSEAKLNVVQFSIISGYLSNLTLIYFSDFFFFILLYHFLIEEYISIVRTFVCYNVVLIFTLLFRNKVIKQFTNQIYFIFIKQLYLIIKNKIISK